MIIIQIFNLSLDNFSFFTELSFSFNYHLDCFPQFEPIMFRTVKYVIAFRIGHIVSQHHQQFILLQLFYQYLTILAQLTLNLFDSVGVVSNEMIEHALLIATAEDGAFQRLVCSIIGEFDRKEIFYSE